MKAFTVRVDSIDGRTYSTLLTSDKHGLIADEPEGEGGEDLGPSPMRLAVLALGACTSITLKMYAARKGWALEGVSVDLSHDVVDTPDGRRDRIERRIAFVGELDAEARERLMAIAAKCPVARLIGGGATIVDRDVSC